MQVYVVTELYCCVEHIAELCRLKYAKFTVKALLKYG